jgi:FAD/FMN-containing dehydrogenase
MYVGTSLGKCINSLVLGEVPIESVLFIVTQTRAATYEEYMKVVESYITRDYWSGNAAYPQFANDAERQDKARHIADYLYRHGLVHQPRNFNNYYSHGRLPTWLEVVPTLETTNAAVMDAYDKYRTLVTLIHDGN